MTVTYKTLWEDMPNVKIPILHAIHYDHHVVNKDEMNIWLRENCKASYYRSPPWYGEQHCVQFEDDEDAVLFALRWA
jgi:hypothetical protein